MVSGVRIALHGPRFQSGPNDRTSPAIELRGISKAFGPVQANKDISIR